MMIEWCCNVAQWKTHDTASHSVQVACQNQWKRAHTGSRESRKSTSRTRAGKQLLTSQDTKERNASKHSQTYISVSMIATQGERKGKHKIVMQNRNEINRHSTSRDLKYTQCTICSECEKSLTPQHQRYHRQIIYLKKYGACRKYG